MASHMSAPAADGGGESKKKSKLPLVIPIVILALAALVYFTAYLLRLNIVVQ